MADYPNSIDVNFLVAAKIFGNTSASEAEATAIKARLIAHILGLNIWTEMPNLAIKVITAVEVLD